MALIDWPETRTCRPIELAVGVEAGRHLALRDRAVEIVRLIFLAAPDHLDRRVGEFLRDLDRLMDVVLRAAAPAEAAAEIVAVDLAFVERNAGGLRQRRQRRFEVLRRHPALGLVGRQLHGGSSSPPCRHARGTASNRPPRSSSRASAIAFSASPFLRSPLVAVASRPSLSCSAMRRARDSTLLGLRPRRSAAHRAPSWRATRCRRPRRRAVSLTFTTFFTPGMPATLLSSIALRACRRTPGNP